MTTDFPNYELLDFGQGRRLERFGDYVLDRPALGTENIGQASDLWQTADARYTGDRATDGSWAIPNKALHGDAANNWLVNFHSFSLKLRLAPSGQVGVFPEQAGNWHWIAEQVRQFQQVHQRPPKVLNLFAYTGGSTLAAAAAGAEVAHVDSSGSVVNWARENAAASGLSLAPVRWLVEDAMRFVERELRRENGYDAVILDPPSYGHGGGKRVWKIEQRLPELLRACVELGNGRLSFLLLTAHTREFDARRLERLVRQVDSSRHLSEITSGHLAISTRAARHMSAGCYVRASMNQSE